MKFNELQASKNKSATRVGRGIAAGKGKTAGRGTKGQNSRTGSKNYATFMGGQGPLMRRIPKHRGFKSLRVPAQVVYTAQLNEFDGQTVDANVLAEAGIIATAYHSIKVILRGDVTAKVAIKAQGISKGALEAVTQAGGSFEKIDVPHLPSSARKADKKAEEAQ